MVDLRSTLCEYCVKVNLQQLHVQYLMAITCTLLYTISQLSAADPFRSHMYGGNATHRFVRWQSSESPLQGVAADDTGTLKCVGKTSRLNCLVSRDQTISRFSSRIIIARARYTPSLPQRACGPIDNRLASQWL